MLSDSQSRVIAAPAPLDAGGRKSHRGYVREFLAAFGIAMAIYGYTLAPTVTWGDSAKLINNVIRGSVSPTAAGHPLHAVIGQLFIRLPMGDPAFRLNLMSALFAATAVAFVYLTLREMGLSRMPAGVGAGSLMVSHTFWTTAVIAESYAIMSLGLAVGFWSWHRWLQSHDDRWLSGAVAAPAIAASSHALALSLVLGICGSLLWEKRIRGRYIRHLAAGVLAGAILYAALFVWSVQERGFVAVMQGIGASRQVEHLWLTWPGGREFARSLLVVMALLVYQFLPLNLIAGALGWRSLSRYRQSFFRAVLLVIAVTWIFMGCYGRQRQFLMGLPCYIAFSYLIGFGWQRLVTTAQHRSRLLGYGAALGLLCTPIAYAVVPRLIEARGITLGIRPLRYRDPVTYFLYPPKQAEYGARHLAEEVFATAPPHAVVLADFTAMGPLRYLHLTTSRRPDVDLILIDAPLTPLDPAQVRHWLQTSRPVWLLDSYDVGASMAGLRRAFDIRAAQPFGYRFTLNPTKPI